MKQTIIVIVIVVIVAGGIFLINKAFRSSKPTPKAQSTTTASDTTNQSIPGLKIQDLTAGTGPAAKAGDKLTVIYTGTLTDGTVFDSNVGKSPFSFTLGAGQVISGWDQGLVGMKVSGRRKLTIDPSLGYGAQSAGSIPPNSTLIFDVELTGIN